MFGRKRRCTDQLSKHGTQKSISQHVPHQYLPFFHVNIRKINTERNPHTCWLSHTHVKCIIKSVSIMHVYSVPDAKMIILCQSGQTRVTSVFLTFKSLSSCPLPTNSGFTSYFLHFWLWLSWLFFNRNIRFCIFSCWTGGSIWPISHLV